MTQDIIGQTLLNKYRVDAYVASGGMGTVFRVWDRQRNVPLAMKVLHGDPAEDPSIFKRFKREARALEKLAHPNIVPFYGLYQTLDFAFLLERFIDGPTLKQVLRRRGSKPVMVQEALTYLKVISSALGYAHAHGVVHCDVKPGNVMVDQGGAIYLTDFGVARHAESTTTTLGFAGTAAYMAPEQIRGEAVTAATDVYALGVMLYEMLAGRRPFRGDEAGTEKGGATGSERVRYAHMHLPAPDPREFNPELAGAVAEVILRALEKSPADRFASAPAFFKAVLDAVNASPDSIRDRIMLPEEFRTKPFRPSAEVRSEDPIQPSEEVVVRGMRRPTWLIVSSLVAIVGLLLLFVYFATNSSKERRLTIEEQAAPVVIAITATGERGSHAAATRSTRVKPSLTRILPSPTSPRVIATNIPTVDTEEQREVKIIKDVREYWSLVNRKRFEEAWDYLTPHFKKKYLDNSYNAYVEGWQYTDSIEVVDVKVLDAEVFKATADVWLIFTADTVVLERHIRLQLAYSEYLKIWEIYESTFMP